MPNVVDKDFLAKFSKLNLAGVNMGTDDAVRLAKILSTNKEHLDKLQELDVSRNQIGAVGALAFNEQFALLLPADRKFTMSLVQNDISNEQAGLLNLQGSLLRPRQKLAVLAPRTGAQNVEGGILVVKLRDQEFRFRCTWMAAQERINNTIGAAEAQPGPTPMPRETRAPTPTRRGTPPRFPAFASLPVFRAHTSLWLC